MNKITINKTQVRQAFSQSATSYDSVAVLQQEINSRLLERLQYIKYQPQTILDLGSGTGSGSRGLKKRYKHAKIFALDFALPMLQQAKAKAGWLDNTQYICGDAERLPIQSHSMGMLYSNLMLQWCDNLEHTFYEWHRILAPNSLVMFTTFGPDTLRELKASWANVDNYSHVNQFVDMYDIGDQLLKAGFVDPVMDAEWLTLTYNDVYALMKDLKTLGSHNMTSNRCQHFTSKSTLKAMVQAYEYYRQDGVIPASYEVIYGHAWMPETKSKFPIRVTSES